MAETAGQYTPPPIVFDADEASPVAQPLLAEHEQGSLALRMLIIDRCSSNGTLDCASR